MHLKEMFVTLYCYIVFSYYLLDGFILYRFAVKVCIFETFRVERRCTTSFTYKE
jgi:hypothetical protein